MKLTCHQSDLLISVNVALKAISPRTTLSILKCIYLQATNDHFKVIANDLEIGIESTVDATIAETGSVAIDSRIFSDIIRKLPTDYVTIVVDETNRTTITCQKSKFVILGQAGTEFIQLPEIKKEENLSFPQNKLKEMIHQTLFSIAQKSIKSVLTGELLEIKNNVLSIVSMDGYRISITKMELEKPFRDIIAVIPGKTLGEISKILSGDEDENIYIYFTDKHVLFEIKNSIIVSRLLEDKYPAYRSLFSIDYDTLIHVDRKEFIVSIERAALIGRESKKSPIKISIKKDTMAITSNTELGNVYEELDIDKDGEELDIAFNPKYLLEALKVVEDEKIYLQFTNNINPCIIRQKDEENYKFLILPIKINA